MVPTLIPINETTGQPDESKSVFESIVTIEYLDQVSGAKGNDRLISQDPFWYARSRYWADKVNRECCSTYYGVLVRKEESERRDHFHQLVKGLTNFSAQLKECSGPTFLPDAQLSNVDLTLLPWVRSLTFIFSVLFSWGGEGFYDNNNLLLFFLIENVSFL